MGSGQRMCPGDVVLAAEDSTCNNPPQQVMTPGSVDHTSQAELGDLDPRFALKGFALASQCVGGGRGQRGSRDFPFSTMTLKNIHF